MLTVNSNVKREDKQKLMRFAKKTVEGYHQNRLKNEKKINAIRRVAGIPKNNTNNNQTLGRMLPTALRIKSNAYNTLPNNLKNKKNTNTEFKKNPEKFAHVNLNYKKGIGIVQTPSYGMNSSNYAVTRLRPGNKLRNIPWQWSCPMVSEMQPHQYTGAISSTRLGNNKMESNPTLRNDGYVPTGQLLYHSAGSGKTLLMLLTTFFWMLKWWGAQSAYSQSPQKSLANSNKANDICNLIIFISEKKQVSDMKGKDGLDLFLDIMVNMTSKTAQSEAHLKFIENIKTFHANLPQKKVVLKFSTEQQPSEKLRGMQRYPDKDAWGTVKSWKGTDEVAMICKYNHPFFKRPVPTMGMIKAGEATYTTSTNRTHSFAEPKTQNNVYRNNFGDDELGRTYLREFNNNVKGYSQLNIFLQSITYVYSVLLMDAGTNKLQIREAYNKLKSEYQYIYTDYNIGKGAYHQFTEEMVNQLYSRVKVYYTLAKQYADLCLTGPDGVGARGMSLYYRSVNTRGNNRGRSDLVDMLQEGDFVRFRVAASAQLKNLDFDQLAEHDTAWTDERTALGGHWKEWTEQNKGGVSPFFKVMNVKKVKYASGSKEFTFIKLQRMLIHKFTENGSLFHPLFPGDSDEVQTDKLTAKPRTVAHSNIKKGFELYDIIRPSYQPQDVTPVETFCDSANMRQSQQTLPSQALKLILSNSGAEMRDDQTYGLAPKEDTSFMSEWGDHKVDLRDVALESSNLWWVPYGEHSAWANISEEDRKQKWNNMTKTRNGTLSPPRTKDDDLLKSCCSLKPPPTRDAPMMPKTLLLGMTSQMALQLFHKLPDGALFIVDEIQKYVGNQDKPEKLSSKNNVIERQNFFCMLSEAVKPKQNKCAADNNTRNNNNFSSKNKKSTTGENYTSLCERAAQLANSGIRNKNGNIIESFSGLPYLKPLKGNSNSKRKFSISPGGGQIQGASATPSIVTLGTVKKNDTGNSELNQLNQPVNELERMFRLIGQCRNQRVQPITSGMLKPRTIGTTKINLDYVKRKYRRAMEKYLKDSKVMISFVDLAMDVTKVPMSTSRGRDVSTRSSSIVNVDIDRKIRKQRMHPANFGLGDTVEKRIGYPSMYVVTPESNNIKRATQTPRAAQTPRAQTPKEKQTKTKQNPKSNQKAKAKQTTTTQRRGDWEYNEINQDMKAAKWKNMRKRM